MECNIKAEEVGGAKVGGQTALAGKSKLVGSTSQQWNSQR